MQGIAVLDWQEAAPLLAPEAGYLGELAVQALRCEALLTPKPGLVDQRGPGAHHDLSLALLLESAEALRPGFVSIAAAASGQRLSLRLREELGDLGRAAERSMLGATKGVNTHRGAIWAVGLLVAGCAMGGAGASAETVVGGAAALAALPDRFAPIVESHGRAARRLYGGSDARQEARLGFPHMLRRGWPVLLTARKEGATEDEAQVLCLLAIMATLNDTCLLHRGGPRVLEMTQRAAERAYRLGGTRTAMGRAALQRLDDLLLAAWASPGGSADLLAATLFLDRRFPAEAALRSTGEGELVCRN